MKRDTRPMTIVQAHAEALVLAIKRTNENRAETAKRTK